MKNQLWQLGLQVLGGVLLMASLAVAQAPQIELEIDKFAPDYSLIWSQQLDDLRGVKPSSHWMGVVVRPADELLRKHLRIDGGLVVDQVTKDSPAAAGGIQQHDILLTCNDVSVADFKGLMEFLTENKEKEITVQLLREGKKKSLKVTPTERPKGQVQFFEAPKFDFTLPPEGIRTAEQWKKWMEKWTKENPQFQWKPADEGAAKLRFFHPGVILGEDVDIDIDISKLPEGLKVLVLKEGDKPAKITVQRGDDKWEVTEKELDKLPEDVRGHVKKYLGKASGAGIRVEGIKVFGGDAKDFRPLKVVPAPGAPKVQARAFRVEAAPGAGRIDEKLDEINKRLERIEKVLEKLSEK